MKHLLYLLFVITLMSCGTTKQAFKTCATKSTKTSQIKKLDKVVLAEAEKLTYKLAYHVLAPVAPEDTTSIELDILRCHGHINEKYSAGFNFQRAELVYYSEAGFNLDFASNKKEDMRDYVKQIEEEGVINVYILPDSENGLLGFTVVFPTCKHCYADLAPKYDNVLIGIGTLKDPNTLAHELGHFFGLPHTFALKPSEYAVYGLHTARMVCINTMNYGCCTQEITPEQVGIMYSYGIENRHNLIQPLTVEQSQLLGAPKKKRFKLHLRRGINKLIRA